MNRENITAVLDLWTAQWHPSLDEYVIWGNIVVDDKQRFPDGTRIHTSGISTKNFPPEGLREGDIVKTRNSVYKLGSKLDDLLVQ